jgi:signal transduction histidine kinase
MRLTALLGVLLTTASMLLGIPWARSVLLADTRTAFYELTSDATQLATQAAAVRTDQDVQGFQDTLQRYHEVYGAAAVLLDSNGSVQQAFPHGYRLPGSSEHDVHALVTGNLLTEPGPAWPWNTEPLVAGQPVVRDGDLIGAVVISALDGRRPPTGTRALFTLLAVTSCAIILSAALSRVLAGWVLRPVRELGRATGRIHDGELGAQVMVEKGPPELRSLAIAFNRMSRRMQQVMEAQQHFVSDASHQLRNPLNALILRLEGLAPRAEPDDGLGDGPAVGSLSGPAVDDALSAGRRLARTLDDMLALARAVDGVGDAAPFDVAEIVDDRLAQWAVVAEHREVRMVRTGARSALAHHARECVEGALDSVIDNALKFCGPGSTVTVDVAPASPEVIVTVRDEGPGVLESELPHITDRFWRSRRHANVPGSGLGVPIASSLLTRHGGRLDVANHENGGLVVQLHLPGPVH